MSEMDGIIKMHNDIIAELKADRDKALTANITLREQQRVSNERIVELEESLQRIADWCAAYPLEVFPEPNLQADKELLGDVEFTRLNVHSMRHVVEEIAKIAQPPKETP